MRNIYKLMLSLVVSLFITSIAFAAEKKPNFVWILSEDNSLHYLDHFFEGGAKTPNIEMMAQNGLTFKNAFSNSPVCSVARTTLATSSYGPRIGTQYHRKLEKAEMPENLEMFQTYLAKVGYYTTNNTKTDYNVNVDESVWHESSSTATWRNRGDETKPFFHMETHGGSHESSLHFDLEAFKNDQTQHDPAFIILADYMPDTELSRYTHARYLDEIANIDDLVGETLNKLKEDDLLEDTFIFYFGDHGGVLPRSKGYAYDDGLHVPLVVRVPENFKHLVDVNANQTIEGFVEFVDFGPTLLALAGIETPSAMDGKPFLGPKVNMNEVEARDQSFGYADRFDEKYDLVRTLRKGKFLYMRNYQPFLPDGLQNNYRYRMLAYTEWRELYKAGKLNDVQKQFHQPKQVEALYDVESDPFNVNNLASDPAYVEVVADLRHRLQGKVKGLPDLSFYSESYLVKYGVFKNPVSFGQDHKQQIENIITTADYALLPLVEAKPKILKALTSEVEAIRMWAITAAASFGKQAKDIEKSVLPFLDDKSLRVRLRAAEYIGLLGIENPQPYLADIINTTDEPVLVLEVLNSVVLFNDYYGDQYPVNLNEIKSNVSGSEIDRRLNYLKEPNILH